MGCTCCWRHQSPRKLARLRYHSPHMDSAEWCTTRARRVCELLERIADGPGHGPLHLLVMALLGVPGKGAGARSRSVQGLRSLRMMLSCAQHWFFEDGHLCRRAGCRRSSLLTMAANSLFPPRMSRSGMRCCCVPFSLGTGVGWRCTPLLGRCPGPLHWGVRDRGWHGWLSGLPVWEQVGVCLRLPGGLMEALTENGG